MSPWLLAELRTHLARQQDRRGCMGLGPEIDERLVFAKWDGSTSAPSWLTQKFGLAMEELQFDCTLQALRHTHVSQIIAAGTDIRTVSRRLGHASVIITRRVYGHLFTNTDGCASKNRLERNSDGWSASAQLF